MLRRVGGRCFPAIYLDGALVRRPGTAEDSIVANIAFDNVTSSNHIQAFEVYASPAQTPPQYGGYYGRCGVILLWTR